MHGTLLKDGVNLENKATKVKTPHKENNNKTKSNHYALINQNHPRESGLKSLCKLFIVKWKLRSVGGRSVGRLVLNYFFSAPSILN